MAQPLRTTNMSTVFLIEPNIKKRKFMKNRFLKLKGLVYRYIQFLSFREKLIFFFTLIEKLRISSASEAVSTIKDLFTYIYNTRDIWTSHDNLSTTIKKKIIELMQQKPTDFKPYMLRFGYSCPYITRKDEICGKRVDGTVCKIHSKSQYRLHCLILHSLPSIPTDLSNIVFHYCLPSREI